MVHFTGGMCAGMDDSHSDVEFILKGESDGKEQSSKADNADELRLVHRDSGKSRSIKKSPMPGSRRGSAKSTI